jgi:hypothetical protein
LKPATIRDVAERADVSVASVSRVLNGAGPVTEATRQRVLEAVEALQYVPHSGARSLSTSKTNTVGVILPDLYGEFFSELIRGMDVAARALGYHLIVSSSHDDADEASSAIRSMRGRVDGLIVLSPHLGAANLASGLAGRMPVLLMNGGVPTDGRPSIVVDNHGGAVAAVEHLIAIGRKRIAHIAGPAGNLEAEARLAGYLEAMAKAGLPTMVVDGSGGGREAGRSRGPPRRRLRRQRQHGRRRPAGLPGRRFPRAGRHRHGRLRRHPAGRAGSSGPDHAEDQYRRDGPQRARTARETHRIRRRHRLRGRAPGAGGEGFQ